MCNSFQSTHPRRVRPTSVELKVITKLISIHAPAKGATFLFLRQLPETSYFNPRTREGCDLMCYKVMKLCLLFQSTHPRRVRHFYHVQLSLHLIISIHAPAKGATKTIKKRLNIFLYFNPRTREGCDVNL